jgi:glycosyltransferase involved in cell wall biosynthesis
MKKIVFINQDAGYLMIDIINAHVAQGYECVLITGRLVERKGKLNENVVIDKTIKYNKKNILFRLFTWIFSFLNISFKVISKYRDYELFIVSNPPIISFLPLLVKNKYKFLIYDIYPDVFVEFGYMRANTYFLKIWEKINTAVYSKAQNVFCLTEGMKKVLGKYCDEQSIEVVSLWSGDNESIVKVKDLHSFLESYKINECFRIVYSGNIGLTSGLDILVDLANELKEIDRKIKIIVIGNGAYKKYLLSRANSMSLKNIIFIDWLESIYLPIAMSSSNLSVVCLGDKASNLAIPSKLFTYMSYANPILCISSNETDLAKIVNEHKVGQVFNQNELKYIVNFILEISSNDELRSYYSKNSELTSKYFTSKNAQKFVK